MEDVKDLIREASRLAQFYFGYEELIWLTDKTCRLTILKELQAEIPGVSIRGASFQSECASSYPAEYWELCVQFMLDALDAFIKGRVAPLERETIFLSNDDFIYGWYELKEKKREVYYEFFFKGLHPDVFQMLEKHLTPEEIKVIKETAKEFLEAECDDPLGYLIFPASYFPDRATFEAYRHKIAELSQMDGFKILYFSNSFTIFMENLTWLPFEDIVYQIIQKLKPAPEQGKEE